MRALRLFLPLSVAAMVLAGCAPAAVSQSDLDTPEYHYRLGLRSLDDGDYSTARTAFQRAVDLDKKFAVGWGGLGLTQAYMGDAEGGESSVDKGVSLNGQSADTHIFRGRYYIVIQNGKWFAEAQKSLNRAIALDRGNESAKDVLTNKYLAPQESSPWELWVRQARAMASVERNKKLRKTWEKRFLGILEDFRFVPGGRIMHGAGRDNIKTTLNNCYVVGIKNDSILKPSSLIRINPFIELAIVVIWLEVMSDSL